MRLKSCFGPLPASAVLCTAALMCAAPVERRAKLAVSHARSLPEAATASTMRGPVAGYVVTPDGSALRAVLGLPGASVFGDIVSVPADVTRIHLAPHQGYALAEMAAGSPVAVLVLDNGAAVSAASVEGGLARADLAVFNPAGRSAALFSREVGLVQVLSGLPGEPRVVWEYDVRTLAELPELLAVSDDGESVIAGGGSGRLWLLMRDGSARLIFSAADLAAAEFFPGRTDVAVFDRGRGTVSVLEDVAGRASTRLLAVWLGWLDGPISMAVSTDGSGVLITNPGGKKVLWIDVASADVRELEVPSSPLRLERMRYGDTFLLSSEPGKPAWILAREGSEIRLVFVPAMKDDESQVVSEAAPGAAHHQREER